VKEMLHIWPPLPILVWSRRSGAVDNVIAALEHRDRVCRIYLNLRSSQLERFAAVMQEPFPALTYLHLESDDQIVSALPNMFLGASAPRLQFLNLWCTPIPTLPKLLLSSNELVDLQLWMIPNTGYISPEAMVAALSVLTRLETLSIEFTSPYSLPNRRTRRSSPPTRTALLSLKALLFRGVNEYLEDLVAHIDAPQLQFITIIFFNRLIFDTRQLSRFIFHVGVFTSFKHAKIAFNNYSVEIRLHPLGVTDFHQHPRLKIRGRGFDWQVSSMAQICRQFFLSDVEQLDIVYNDPLSTLKVDMDNTQWLELFQSFTAVRVLRISQDLQFLIASALQELPAELAKDVLPALSSLYLEVDPSSVPAQEALEPFITARQYSGHPVAIQRFESSLSRWP
jgi:hypothetical protein